MSTSRFPPAVPARLGFPHLGFGVALRPAHCDFLLQHWPRVDCLEIRLADCLAPDGWPLPLLQRVAARYPILIHGHTLALGADTAFGLDGVRRLRALADGTGAHWISEKLHPPADTDQDAPLPLNEATLGRIAGRIHTVQEQLGRPLILENPARTHSCDSDTLTEAEFLATLAAATGCGLLLDVNKLYVASAQLGFDPYRYVDALPAERIVQFHLSGHAETALGIVCSRDRPVGATVWTLYRYAYRRCGGAATVIEWDERLPDFPTLHEEALKARSVLAGRDLLLGAAGTLAPVPQAVAQKAGER